MYLWVFGACFNPSLILSHIAIVSLFSVQCPEPPSVAFADHNGPKQTHFNPGTEVFYTCRSGFVSDGISMAKCKQSGSWAGPLMSCRGEWSAGILTALWLIENMHVSTLPILQVLTIKTVFWCAGLQLQWWFYFSILMYISYIACINHSFLCTVGLVMDVQNRTCPEFVKFKVDVLNCQCRADKR